MNVFDESQLTSMVAWSAFFAFIPPFDFQTANQWFTRLHLSRIMDTVCCIRLRLFNTLDQS